MTRSTAVKLGLLASLYFAQGLPFGFFTQALPVILREQGVSLAAIGFTAILALPWALKFLWAPYVDRYGSERFGRRRSWILPLQALGVLLLLVLAHFPPERGLAALLVAVALTNLVAATQDIATDGLAVDLLEPSERGYGNGVQVAGYRAGMIVGGGLILALLDLLGWRLACRLLALGLLLSSLPLLIGGEPRPRDTPQAQPQLPSLWGTLRRPGFASWLVLLTVFKLGDALGGGMLRPFLVDLGHSKTEIGWLLGIGGFTTGLLGALAGGAGVSLLGRKRALLAFGLLQATGMGVYVFAALLKPGLWPLAFLVGYEHFVGGMATAALFTLMMDACDPKAAATDYTLQACVVVLATGGASGLSGVFAEQLGYAGLFGLAAVLAVAGTLIFVRDPRVERPEELASE